MKLELAKGVRDVSPGEKIAKNKVADALREIFELYGYSPIETPVLERESVLASKYTGGEEILKEMFTLEDQGKRKLALRYDLTVPFARYIGMNPQIKIPFRRYQIDKVFRDGPIKLGRYREFWQCDVDIMGCKTTEAEAELLSIASRVLEKLELRGEIKINSRKILNSIIESSGADKNLENSVILAIDKLEKTGMENVEKELAEKGLEKEVIKKIKENISIRGNNSEKIAKLKKILVSQEGKEGLEEVESLLMILKDYRVDVVLDISLARGLSYYTGIVFEIFAKDSDIKSAIAAGGRYDNMIADLLDSKKEFPAVGISFGLDVISDAMKKEEAISVAEVYVISVNAKKDAVLVAERLRKNEVNVLLDIMNRGISKNLDYANSLKIPFVLIIGEEEVKQKKYKLKDMKTGKEELLDVEDITKKLK